MQRRGKKKVQSRGAARRPSRRDTRGESLRHKATHAMTMSDLQAMAKARGVPFGGLSKAKLVRKINNYM